MIAGIDEPVARSLRSRSSPPRSRASGERRMSSKSRSGGDLFDERERFFDAAGLDDLDVLERGQHGAQHPARAALVIDDQDLHCSPSNAASDTVSFLMGARGSAPITSDIGDCYNETRASLHPHRVDSPSVRAHDPLRDRKAEPGPPRLGREPGARRASRGRSRSPARRPRRRARRCPPRSSRSRRGGRAHRSRRSRWRRG